MLQKVSLEKQEMVSDHIGALKEQPKQDRRTGLTHSKERTGKQTSGTGVRVQRSSNLAPSYTVITSFQAAGKAQARQSLSQLGLSGRVT